MFGRSRANSSRSRANSLDHSAPVAAALAVSDPTDVSHRAGVSLTEEGHAAEGAVPAAVLEELRRLRPSVSGPTDVRRRASVQRTSTGELRASEAVPKDVLAMLPAASVGAADIGAPTHVTKLGGLTRTPSGRFSLGASSDGVPKEVLEMLPTVDTAAALCPASVSRVHEAFCAAAGGAQQRSLGPQELLQCLERLNARRPAEWAAVQILRFSQPREHRVACGSGTGRWTPRLRSRSSSNASVGAASSPGDACGSGGGEFAIGGSDSSDGRLGIEQVLRCVSREVEGGAPARLFAEYAEEALARDARSTPSQQRWQRHATPLPCAWPGSVPADVPWDCLGGWLWALPFDPWLLCLPRARAPNAGGGVRRLGGVLRLRLRRGGGGGGDDDESRGLCALRVR